MRTRKDYIEEMKALDPLYAGATNENFSLSVSGYTTFKDREREIIADIIAGAPTLKDLVPMTGVKANTTVELNILTAGVDWTSGDCDTFGPSQSTVIAPRSTAVKRIKDFESICLDKIDAVLPFIQSAGARNEELPFADLFMNLKIEKNANELEKAIWISSATGSNPNGNFNLFDGFLTIADTETSSLAHFGTFSSVTSGNAISTIRTMLANRSEAMYQMNDLILSMNNATFDTVSQAIIDTYGIAGTGVFTDSGDENQSGSRMMKFPGTNVTLRATHGLDSNGSLWLTNKSNMRYLTDMTGDSENVSLKYSDYHDKLTSKLVYAIGVNYEFPGNVVYLKKV